MHQSIRLLMAGLLVPASIFTAPTTAIAHQGLQSGDVEAVVHLQPNDSPYAGEASLTWFHLTRSNGETIPLSDCACSLVVYNAQNQAIAQPELTDAAVSEHAQPISTNITFPAAGNYQLVLTGQSKSNSFSDFELTVPVRVRP